MSDPNPTDVDPAERASVAERAAKAGSDVGLKWFRERLDVDTKTGPTDYVTKADRGSQERIVEVIRDDYPDDVIVAEEGTARKTLPAEGTAWLVDPIDGTFEFVRGLPLWAVSVACVRDGEPVAAVNALPALDELYVAANAAATTYSFVDGNAATVDGTPASVSERDDAETFAAGIIDWHDFDADEPSTGLVRGFAERFGEVRRLGSSQTTLTYVASGALDVAVSTNPNPWNNVAGAHLIARAGGTVTDAEGRPWKPGAEYLVASNGTAHDVVLETVGNHRP
ncbi:inositol monophosphatase family protein [Haladaptatus salinisoli]|uniref:inositol monophosphatase family protein n=1 Tax=Haladaptatus salinisoli TaxID=2884876 RepID=UPI001D0BB6AD|nr:inositol monophosphatase [Haladaptatus salinisoli]